jgi:hypothetical protein
MLQGTTYNVPGAREKPDGRGKNEERNGQSFAEPLHGIWGLGSRVLSR